MQKVFGIGFSKTGTTSLESALSILGYNTWRGHWQNPNLSYAIALYLYNDIEKLFDIINYYDALADAPWGGSDLYREIYKRLPTSKFILTIRDAEDWYDSFERMITKFDANLETALDTFHAKERYGAVHFFKEIFDIETLAGNKQKIIETYTKYNQNAISFLSERKADFIIYDIPNGDGWEKLCIFLEKPIPSQPFPHKNKSTVPAQQSSNSLSEGTVTTQDRIPQQSGKISDYFRLLRNLFLVRSSGLFDRSWYLSNNPDVAQAKVNPLIHYLRNGGVEGRDPGPNFSSKWYLDTYADVRKAGINPLVHYLKYGAHEGRLPYFQNIEHPNIPYQCPVCKERISNFVPIPIYYEENLKKYGYPYTFDDAETLNAEKYTCPYCSATDRDRLYAYYIEKRIAWQKTDDKIRLLDIAPSVPLSSFISRFDKIKHDTADLLVEGVDLAVDITNMPEIATDTYDILICSHVLEHVDDDKKAISELHRVLKQNGWGIIMVPIVLAIDKIDEDTKITDVAERWRRFGQDDHVRLYSKAGFVNRLENAGFVVHQLGVDYFGEDVFKKHGIGSKSILYLVEKKVFNQKQLPLRDDCDFFFIVGTGRSGTTLMAQVLNAHSQICVPIELQITVEESNNGARLAEIFETQKNLKFRTEDYIKLIEDRCPHDVMKYYDYHDFFNRIPYPVLSLQWLLTKLYSDIAHSKGKTIFAEQTPWYGQHIGLFNRLFPRAKFIHMVRDGRDVAISFARTPWWHKDINLNLERWAYEVNKIERDGMRLLEDRILTVRYEDFVLESEKVTRMVCTFLEVHFEETMLDPNLHIDYGQFSRNPAKVVSSQAYQKWQREKKNAFFSDSVYGWKTNENANFENIGTETLQLLQRFGYEV
jgi:SAM-dependent methyltransferase